MTFININKKIFPLVSIITPSWNSEEYIEQTIQSVLAQTYPNIEYIIVDGKSTDRTLEVIKRYEHKITHWVSEPDEGMYQAINKGFGIARGDIFAYLNSDDLYFPETIEKVVELFLKNPTTDLIFGSLDFIDVFGIKMYTQRYPNFNWKRFACSKYAMLGQPASFWKRSLFLDAGGFDESLKMAADFDFYIKAGKVGAFFHTNKTLACFRVHPASLTSRYLAKSNKEISIIHERYQNPDIRFYERFLSDIFFKTLNWRIMLIKLINKMKKYFYD